MRHTSWRNLFVISSVLKGPPSFGLHRKTARFYSASAAPVSVKISGQDYFFPAIWLRDNCLCQKCFHKPSQSRIIDWSNFDIRVKPVSFKTSDKSISIEWSDGHRSEFELAWLLERSFRSEDQQNYLDTFYRPKKILWSENDCNEILKEYSYDAVLSDDTFLKEWLYRLSVYGLAFLNNVPPSTRSNRTLVDRIGFIRKTHYGEEYEVKADPNENAVNVAYLSHNLQLHTDLPYYEYKPGATMLHYLEQSNDKGAENMFADMHYVASELKRIAPELYKALSTTLVDWTDIGEQDGKKFYSIYRSPVIVEDESGNITRINHSIPQRGSHFNVSIDKAKLWYEALHKLVELAYKHAVYLKPVPGTLLAFDNTRLVHGRTKYQDTPGNTRYLIGCYIDWDEIYSKLRCLINQK